MSVTVTDLFCGAGGSGLGATAVPGVELVMAANHSELAIETHAANFPGCAHDVADISQVQPQRYRRTNILWASPECFVAGTLILTARGLVPIEDVAVGDEVLTHRSRYRAVSSTMQREAPTVRIAGQGLSRGLEVTGNHMLWTRPDKTAAPEWRRVDGLAQGQYWSTPHAFPDADIPAVGGPRPLHVADTRFAWLVGRWLGDGSLRVRPRGSDETFITCGNHEADGLEKCLSWTHHPCEVCPPELTWSRRQLKTAVVFANSHSELARWLVEHFGKGAHSKTIPAWALGAPQPWREALLAGYISADGCDTGRGYTAASVSKRLALGIRLLAESLGHRTQLHYSHRDTWRIDGRSGRARPQWTVTWLHDEVRPRAFIDELHTWASIRANEAASESAVVYDLTVDEDHSFVADGIVAHNCTWQSGARGRRRDDHPQRDLFGDDDPNEVAERSRSTMWDVPRFTEWHYYDAIIVENVVETVTRWPLWPAWLHAMDCLGYRVHVVSLNSMHAPAIAALRAPQSRDRIYAVCTRRGSPEPDLEPRPASWCPHCDRRVGAVQWWKRHPRPRAGKYGPQYAYRCPDCREIVEPQVVPAAVAIDWTLPGQRIGDRKTPLRPKTMARIQAGLDKYAGAQLVPTEGREGKVAQSVEVPMRTQTARHETALVVPYYGTGQARTTEDPLPTHPTRDRFGLAFIAELRGGGSTTREVTEPLATVTAGGNNHMLVRNNGTRDGGDGQMCTSVTEPARTITTAGHQSLVGWPRPAPSIDDCTFRMLDVPEIAAAMAFRDDYVIKGRAKRDRVRQLGNAVTPPAAEFLIWRVVESLEAA